MKSFLSIAIVVFGLSASSLSWLFAEERRNGGDLILQYFTEGLTMAPTVAKKLNGRFRVHVKDAIPANLKDRGVSKDSLQKWIKDNLKNMAEDLSEVTVVPGTPEQKRCAETGSNHADIVYINLEACKGQVNSGYDALWILFGEAAHHLSEGRADWSKVDEDSYAALVATTLRLNWKTFVEEPWYDEVSFEDAKERMYNAIIQSDSKGFEKVLSEGLPVDTLLRAGESPMYYAIETFTSYIRIYQGGVHLRQQMKIIKLILEHGGGVPPNLASEPFFKICDITAAGLPSSEHLEIIDEYFLLMIEYFEKDPAILGQGIDYASMGGRLELLAKLKDMAGDEFSFREVVNSAVDSRFPESVVTFTFLEQNGITLSQFPDRNFLEAFFYAHMKSTWTENTSRKLELILNQTSNPRFSDKFIGDFFGKLRLFTLNRDNIENASNLRVVHELLGRLSLDPSANINAREDAYSLSPLENVVLTLKVYRDYVKPRPNLYAPYLSEDRLQKRIENLNNLAKELVSKGASNSNRVAYITQFDPIRGAGLLEYKFSLTPPQRNYSNGQISLCYPECPKTY